MLRAFCSAWDGGESLPDLDREEIHHLVRVRRVRVGEPIEILNGRGHTGKCRVEAATQKELRLTLETAQYHEPRRPCRHLLVALPKGKTFPALLQKMVELGVNAITPLMTAHSEVPPERAGKKAERWESVLVEAVKQSGNPWLPRLDSPIELAEALNQDGPETKRICAALQDGARPLSAVMQDSLAGAESVQVFVGPEGDFSEEEYALLKAAGCEFITLGPLVLRVETAASLVMGVIGLA